MVTQEIRNEKIRHKTFRTERNINEFRFSLLNISQILLMTVNQALVNFLEDVKILVMVSNAFVHICTQESDVRQVRF